MSATVPMITPASQAAYDRLVADGTFDVRTPIEEVGSLGDAAFVMRFPLPDSNGMGLPETVDVRVRIPAQFPYSNVEFTPLDEALRGFSHQEGRTGELCLEPDETYPSQPGDRLRAYVESAQEWFDDAATDALLVAGQPWELPDFRIGRKDLPRPVYFLESAVSFAGWAERIGRFGSVQLVGHRHSRGLVPVRFDDATGPVVAPYVSEGFLDRTVSVMGTWILLPSLVAWRHRPALSFRELEELSRKVGVDLWSVLKRTLKAKPHTGFHYALIGAPIRRIVGEEPTEIHWQPIAFPQQRSGPFVPGTRPKSRTPNEERTFRARMRGALLDHAVPWGEARNVDAARMSQRGVLNEAVRAKRISLLGCGAIGSALAEHLARGGAHDLALFDGETLELENLPRHALAGPEVGRSKAIELARRLTGVHPMAHVRGFCTKLPMLERGPKADREARQALVAAEAYIDCTANDSVFRWIAKMGRDRGQLVLHVFVGAHARMLTICASGRHASCAKVAKKLFADIRDGRTPFTWDEYNPTTAEVTPGAGCWQSTFPARGFDIGALVASAVPIVEQLLSRRWPSEGAALVLRRRDVTTLPDGRFNIAAGAGIIDVAWSAEYR